MIAGFDSDIWAAVITAIGLIVVAGLGAVVKVWSMLRDLKPKNPPVNSNGRPMNFGDVVVQIMKDLGHIEERVDAGFQKVDDGFEKNTEAHTDIDKRLDVVESRVEKNHPDHSDCDWPAKRSNDSSP
tara:strand:+ start:7381 stop:7761 length:381 start_codon:yes stop_codon:yes gene_type:complete